MNVFDAPDFDHHEQVAFFEHRESGLKCIIALHSTALGPACGGTRMHAYQSVDAALTDVLRLSQAMSYKNAMADLPLGGGKAVIIAHSSRDKTEARLLAYGDAINALGGRYIAAMDVGIVPQDMPVIARRTKHIAGYDQSGKSGGDSGPPTALGVFAGLKAAVKHRLGTETVGSLRIAIQGLGKVGMGLAKKLHAEGAALVVADVNRDAVHAACDAFGAEAVSPEAIAAADCDVFSPNALGGVLDEHTIPALKARVIAGGANNQLARAELGAELAACGILYAPDYVINGGGIIRVAGQIFDWSEAEIERRVLAIAQTLADIFVIADREDVPTSVVADRMAAARLAAARSRAAPGLPSPISPGTGSR
jgi:leucine dehydrogenase